MEEIKAVALNSENFRDYGQVLSISKGDPMADNKEFAYWGKVTELAMTEKVSTGFLVCRKRRGVVKRLERHTKTPEILVALEGDSLVCMAKPESVVGADRIEGIQAFHVRQGDAFVMHTGTWHCIPIPVDCEETKFLVVFASGTEADDLEIRDLADAVKVNL
jgi:ureidoglycolate hydrolase